MKRPHILVVEDNAQLSASLRSLLRKEFRLNPAPTLRSAEALLQTHRYDIVLLDRVLPDGDGVDLLSYICREFPETKVCILSQKNELPDRIVSLHGGADAYLGKPFHFGEIRALLLTLLRRGRLYKHHVLQRFSVELDLMQRVLTRKRIQVRLSHRETQLLELFLNTVDMHLSQEQLQEWLYENGLSPNQALIHVNIQRLRRKIAPAGGTIVAHYGTGYHLHFSS